MSGYLKRGLRKNKKINVLFLIILTLIVRLFFLTFLNEKVLAGKQGNVNSGSEQITIDPLKNINIKNFFTNRKQKEICESWEYKASKEMLNSQEALYIDIVEGHPIERMTSELVKQDKTVAAFLIAIAKKESNWGKHSPQKNGKDCFNYWGYRGSYNATASGYSCFDSPAQAVSVVGGRIEDLINQEINTPEKMIVWKCGRNCFKDNQRAVQSWINDVSFYYDKINS